MLAGTNRGLFVYDSATRTWLTVNDLARNIIYSIAEDKNGRLLVGSASGFFVGTRPGPGVQTETQPFTRVEASAGTADAVGSIRAIARFGGITCQLRRGLNCLKIHAFASVARAARKRELISLLPTESTTVDRNDKRRRFSRGRAEPDSGVWN